MAKQPNQQPEKDPSGYDSSVHEFLGQLHRELDRLEQELTEREKKLAHAEQELREGRTRLQNEQELWTRQYSREKELAVKHEEITRRVTSLEASLKDKEEQLRIFAGKNQELREQATQLARQRDEAQARLTEAREQAGIQARRSESLEKQVAALKAAPPANAASLPPRPAASTQKKPVPSPASARPGPETLEPVPDAASRFPLLITLSVGAVIISAALGAWAYASYKPTYYVSGLVRARPGDNRTLSACAELAQADGLTAGEPDVPGGLLTFWAQTPDTRDGVRQVDRTGRQMVALFQTTASAPASQPTSTAAREKILQRVARIEQQLATTTRPAFQQDEEGSRLVAIWTTAEAQRREVDASLSASTGDSTVDATSIQVEPGEIQAAENADTKLRTEVDALKQRERELGEALKRITVGGNTVFETLDRAIGNGTTRLDRALKEDYGAKIRDALKSLNQSLATWKQASAAMSSDWMVQRDALAGGSDLLTCQVELDRTARQFIDTGSATLVQFRQKLEAIAQDAEEPTKGLVLSRALTTDLQPLVDAQQEVTRLARSATLNGNLDLATIIQRVSGLRRQVGDRRAQIESALRTKILDNLKKDRDRIAQGRREELTRRADDLDRQIRQHIEDVRAWVRRTAQRQTDVVEWARLQDERAAALRSLAEIERQDRSIPGSVSEAVSLELGTVRIEPAEPAHRHIVRALLVGFGCLLTCLLGWLAVHSYQTWHRNRLAIEACARELQAATRK